MTEHPEAEQTYLTMVGDRIAACRKNAGLSQLELAVRVRLGAGELREVEHGGGRLDVAVARRIAVELGVTTAQLLDDGRAMAPLVPTAPAGKPRGWDA